MALEAYMEAVAHMKHNMAQFLQDTEAPRMGNTKPPAP